MEKQEKEIVIGKNRLCLGEDNILRVIIAGHIDNKIVIEICQAASQLRSIVDGKVDALVNIENIVTAEPTAIDVGKAALVEEKVGKVAFVGENPVALFVVSPLIGATRKTDLAFFKIEEEALRWLKIRDTE